MNNIILIQSLQLTVCIFLILVGVAIIVNYSMKRMTDKHFINNVINAMRMHEAIQRYEKEEQNKRR